MGEMAERIGVFRELLSSVNNIYLTEFDTNYNAISSNSAHLDLLHLFLMCDQEFIDNIEPLEEGDNLNQIENINRPLIFTNAIGVVWMSDVEIQNGKIHRIYMLGPVFLDDYSVKNIENQINSRHPSFTMKRRFMESLKEIPVINLNRFFEYGIMLHCCLTGKRISVKDFSYPNLEVDILEDEILQERHGTYMAECEILKLVENGNLGYEKKMERYVTLGKVGKMANGNYLRQAKNTVIIFSALCARAAIQGGLSSEIAYQLRDSYIQMVERAETLGKVNEISHSMMGDYVWRVHRGKTLSGELSPQIKESCDYICLHLDEKADIHFLASRLGYTDYYFSNKFKKETGLSVRNFANQKKIERAKELLVNSNENIQDICNLLGYNSQSYFGKIFHRDTGMSPGEYRAKDCAEMR